MKSSFISLKHIESTLSEYFYNKAPKIPADIQVLIVNYGPWILLIGVLFSLQGIIDSMRFGRAIFFSPLAGTFINYASIVLLITTIISIILAGMSIPGLIKKELQGWKWLYYSALVQAVGFALRLELIALVFFTSISLYILFQIRHNYK